MDGIHFMDSRSSWVSCTSSQSARELPSYLRYCNDSSCGGRQSCASISGPSPGVPHDLVFVFLGLGVAPKSGDKNIQSINRIPTTRGTIPVRPPSLTPAPDST